MDAYSALYTVHSTRIHTLHHTHSVRVTQWMKDAIHTITMIYTRYMRPMDLRIYRYLWIMR